MLLFFGTRASKIKDRKLRRTTCPYCKTQDSFTVSTYSKYFHFFWIPIIPLFKTNVAECSHCKKSYAQNEFTPDMNAALQKENETNPEKRPIWQGCGCMVLVGFFTLMFAISLYGVYMRSNDDEDSLTEKDSRKELLEIDMKQLSSLVKRDKDSLAFALKQCVDNDLTRRIKKDKIKYFTRIDREKLLIILHIRDLSEIEYSERKIIIDILEDCLTAMPHMDSISEYYISVEGKWNTILIKTPTDADLGGRFADRYKLLPFYGEWEAHVDTTQAIEIPEVKLDSLTAK